MLLVGSTKFDFPLFPKSDTNLLEKGKTHRKKNWGKTHTHKKKQKKQNFKNSLNRKAICKLKFKIEAWNYTYLVPLNQLHMTTSISFKVPHSK